ncbi:MAG: 4-phosphopantoate--beta-alanine ligase [Caulobacterales bacterium]
MSLTIARTLRELRGHVARWRNANQSIGLAVTMGAIHAGHLGLVRAVAGRCDRVIVSSYFDPRQASDPGAGGAVVREEPADLAALAQAGIDLFYVPDAAVMAPPGYSAAVVLGGPAEPLEGEREPIHLAAVTTTNLKLLLQALPDKVVFGEKDFQMLLVMRRLVFELDLPVDVIAAPVVREADGLPFSTRNRLLSPTARDRAGALPEAILHAAQALEAGAEVAPSLIKVQRSLLRAGFHEVDYVALRAAEDFSPIASPILRRPARILAAAWMDDVRLIDNFAVRPATF